jgi:hypothetical protein
MYTVPIWSAVTSLETSWHAHLSTVVVALQVGPGGSRRWDRSRRAGNKKDNQAQSQKTEWGEQCNMQKKIKIKWLNLMQKHDLPDPNMPDDAAPNMFSSQRIFLFKITIKTKIL